MGFCVFSRSASDQLVGGLARADALMHYYGEVCASPRPGVVGFSQEIGVGTTLLMWLYHVIVKTDIPRWRMAPPPV